MNKIRFSFFVAGTALALAAGGLQAQTSIQRLTFSLTGQYQTNTLYTNTANTAGPLTNEYSEIRNVLITTHSVIKAVALDLDGPDWSNWAGASLVREVNLTNGNEGIFLHTATRETNVSSFFGGSFSNNFTSGLTNAFPGITNNIGGLTNIVNGSTNNPTQFQLNHGWVRMTDPTNSTTNFVKTSGLYYISLNTTNLKFNLVGVGSGSVTNVAGRVNGTLFEGAINTLYLGTAGSFYLNTSTNFFDAGTNPPVNYSGPLHGTFSTTTPSFSTIEGP